MKTKDKPLTKEYLPIKIFIDDLENIQETLLKPDSGFKIETDKYIFSSVEELSEKFPKGLITNLKISTEDPYVTIEFHKLWARIYVSSDKDSEAGMFYKLDQILSAALRKPSFLYSYYTMWTGYIIFPILKQFSQGSLQQIFSVLSYLFYTLVFWAIYIRFSKHSEIVFSKKRDVQSFFIRNKDQLVVGTITAILGVIATIIAFKVGLLK